MSACFFCGDNCRPTTVYAIGEEQDAPSIKVGYAAHLKKRLKQIREATGRDVHILHAVRAHCEFKAMDIEDAAHSSLDQYWSHGEWFACDRDTAASAIDRAARKLGLKGRRL